ncbi:MAG: ABC transporter permease, partial [Chloroflexi bacterium]|nr:ABC transporter permease [Chloroflexota bacterium]
MIEKFRFYTRHSLNDMRVNGQRTIFALLCIAAGVAAIVSLQTLGTMITNSLTGSIQESNRGDIRIYPNAENDVPQKTVDRGRDEGVIASEGGYSQDYFSLAGLGQIQTWFASNAPGTEITYRQVTGETAGFIINNRANDKEQTFIMPFFIDAQKYPLYGERKSEDGKSLSELIQAPTDIVISRNLADTLDAKVGDTLGLSGATEQFTLRGIVPTKVEGGFENILGNIIGYYYVDLKTVELFDNSIKPGASEIYVKLDDPSQAEALNKDFETRFPYLSTITTDDLEEQNNQISDTVNQLVTLMGLISLLIGGIGIVNTMLVIVSRRTTEVAVLKTVGLEAEQVTVLFLVEAALMGVFGSLLGIVLGWVAAYAIKGVAETFLARSLTFEISLTPALTGFVVGIIITTIFGFMPTLAAGQVRPALVLRPTDMVIPKAGRARSLAALVFVMMAISLVAQPLISELVSGDSIKMIAAQAGGFLGLVLGGSLLAGGSFSSWTHHIWWRRIIRWLMFILGLPVLGSVFGMLVPALLILVGTFLAVGVLYVLLWVLIWSIGGGKLSDLWLWKLPKLRSLPLRILIAILSLPIWIINSVVVVFSIPFWILGRIIQRLAFVDLKLSLRSMVATKGRGASTLLALVVGVFTLSLITMLAKTMSDQFETLLKDQVGGNVIVFAAGAEDTLTAVREKLDNIEGVKSYSAVGTFEVSLKSAVDDSTGQRLTYDDLKQNATAVDEEHEEWLRWAFAGVDAREIGPNLPDVKFYQGRQLDASDVGPWNPEEGNYPPIVIGADQAVIATGLEVGDLLTFEVLPGSESGAFNTGDNPEITFEIVGMVDKRANVDVNFGSSNYAPEEAFKAQGLAPSSVAAVVDIDEKQIRTLRREMEDLPLAFVMETRLLNDLLNRFIDQFTSFPILVAGLSLIVGGIVIANSVALSTLERRREIAIMKAVGLQRERVLGMLLLEYGLMGLIGG